MENYNLEGFPLDNDLVDIALGTVLVKDVFFQRPPTESTLKKLANDWLKKNKAAIAEKLREKPELLEFFSAEKERRNEIISVIGDIVFIAGTGIPVLLLLSKLAHYGVEKLLAEENQEFMEEGKDE